MAQFDYTPDQDVKVHEEGAIRLISSAFQSHENGLPEWLKNSADAYAREDAPEPKRVVVVIFDSGRSGSRPSISCLDFSGMTSQMIEENFRIWLDPEAARRGGEAASVQGGHGNGGKSYMTRMFEDYALLHTVKTGFGNRYGVKGGSFRFGYIPDPARGRNLPVTDLRVELGRALAEVGCAPHNLPAAAIQALQQADGFTLVRGVGPKGYRSRIPARQFVMSLQNHPQMARTLELCRVFAIVNGEQFERGKQLVLAPIAPMQGAEEPRVLNLPPVLRDPVSGQHVSTTAECSLPAGVVTLRTSSVSMRWSKKLRHNVVFRAKSGYIGYVPVSELDVQSPYRDRVYGESTVEALEPYKQNDRARLASSPLTRAVERFIGEQIQAYAREFEARDRRRCDQDEKNAISKINEALDRWKNRFLGELMRGLWGPGVIGPPPPPPPLPTGEPATMELRLSHPRAGLGVAFRPSLRFYDRQRCIIRQVPYRWVSDDNNVAMVDEDLMVINTFAYGRTAINAETLDGKLRSNKVPLDVVRICGIRITPQQITIPARSRYKLEALCRLASGEETSAVYLVWTEGNSDVARVSASGLVFAFSAGQTEVTAGDDECIAKEPALVKVLPGGGRDRGDQRGQGFPLVLVSGDINPDPDTMEYRNFSAEDPPVWQEPQDVDRNIWWINSAAPLARLYLDQARGYGYQSREWRMYHLERYIDVIVQIALTRGPAEKEPLTAADWILRWGSQAAEIQAAAVADLTNFIATGELPEE